MPKLSILDIFSNFDYYKEHYLSILSDANLYFSEVENAHFKLQFLNDKKIYLGDLLQLWFSEKWLFQRQLALKFFSFPWGNTSQPEQDLYLFAVEGNILTGNNICKAWCASENKVITTTLDAVLPYYCYFKALTRPGARNETKVKLVRPAV
ncbi:hypothetical protein [Acinetobacter stercoris]|uniref:Uncharacterized protein n=1 Tax=Acinetobacter stercoris TaxID=2126983 RepID=A0A2U3N4M5_9GAMM|nr:MULTISPECIES: hypothetical protein [Acinetobacter]SPL72509.1 hypothetical protein KPC_3687 [Acinetobacter stercoris]